jgi:hypothetical protein
MSKHRNKPQQGKSFEEGKKSHNVREKRTNTVMGSGNEQPDLIELLGDFVPKTRSLPTSPGGREIRGRSSTIEYAGEVKR